MMIELKVLITLNDRYTIGIRITMNGKRKIIISPLTFDTYQEAADYLDTAVKEVKMKNWDLTTI